MPDEREKIFDKYYRSPVTAGVKGTGLGLAIVKAVAEAHGGRVELESDVGKGSTFKMLLPIRSLGPKYNLPC
jgi:signal transduction histidine kinase